MQRSAGTGPLGPVPALSAFLSRSVQEQIINSIRFAGRRLGQDNEQVYRDRLGLDPARIAQLRAEGAI